ncbi:MAG: FAD-dependent oxidoreductase [Clostridia bacterium]|nr:FAD-dependent oxidoreductase [Clostridia bacterium]
MKIDNIKLPVGKSEEEVFAAALKRSGLKKHSVKSYRVLKKSLDARDKSDIKFVYSVEISDSPAEDIKLVLPVADKPKKIGIIGFGPCGIFCALYLARAGLKPIVFERGKSVEERQKSVNKLINERVLDENSNVQFGEGGAGTFSDGKLNTGVSSPYIKTVLKDFVSFGAPADIEYLAKPHIGSDNLPRVVSAMRREIVRLGGEIRFNSKVEDVVLSGGRAVALRVNGENVEVDDVVIAIGHSARDTFYKLREKNFAMERKAFAMGVRIEHLRHDVNVCQYGEKFARVLPSADYSLSSKKAGRGVFTFCMCPGGFVVPSASEDGGVVTNGMSNYLRDGENSNSAVLCEVYPDDFKEGILGGVELQRDLERLAFSSVGSNYNAPVQTFKDFCNAEVVSPFNRVKPTYSVGYESFDLNKILPKFISDSLKIGIYDMGKRLKCFSSADGVLTGVETRSSSPVRILRGEDGTSPTASNVYPAGEGCGYAGGIMSASVDGIKTACRIIQKYTGVAPRY